jgi:tRNA A37 threonylcarbamoyladenosine dehydratase
MALEQVARDGLVLLGCGKMGSNSARAIQRCGIRLLRRACNWGQPSCTAW